MVSDFGFTYEDALLIESVYSRICVAYPNDNSMMWAWRTARVLGGIVYGDGTISAIKWYDVAGIPFTCDESDFYTEVLNFSQDEYMRLASAIVANHNSEYADFAHSQISLAARLAYHLNRTGILSNVYTLSSDENVSFLAGWLGDATIIGDHGTTSFGNDDYHADLDAENIYQLIQSGSSYIDACNQYYASLTTQTRAHYFLSYISYGTVASKIYYELIDKDLYYLMNEALERGDTVTYNTFFNLVNDEQYHIDTIRSNYPDTYDFLCSLRDGLSNMADYQ